VRIKGMLFHLRMSSKNASVGREWRVQ
jgi:hypothetical protein